MAIWKEKEKDPVIVKKDAAPIPEPATAKDAEANRVTLPSTNFEVGRKAPEREMKESLIAAELTIEGKIEGTGHIRIAGRFKGDVNVQGNLTIEQGAKLTGAIRAHPVIVAGEVEGNIEDATRVELLQTGVLTGDLKAGSLTVAAGSRMRGQAEFGWDNAGK